MRNLITKALLIIFITIFWLQPISYAQATKIGKVCIQCPRGDCWYAAYLINKTTGAESKVAWTGGEAKSVPAKVGDTVIAHVWLGVTINTFNVVDPEEQALLKGNYNDPLSLGSTIQVYGMPVTWSTVPGTCN